MRTLPQSFGGGQNPGVAPGAPGSNNNQNSGSSINLRGLGPDATLSRGRTAQGGRPIRSSAGAIGLMQLMPGTWSNMRARLGLGVDPDDPRDNILAGTFYLRLMYDRFGYPGLFAAYNAGPARYAHYLAGRAGLPRETIGYLASVAPDAQESEEVPATARPVEGLFAVRKIPASPPSDRLDVQHKGSIFVALSQEQ